MCRCMTIEFCMAKVRTFSFTRFMVHGDTGIVNFVVGLGRSLRARRIF